VLIGAMNPCPCGYYGDEKHECTCSMGMVQRYQVAAGAASSGLGSASGPLLDLNEVEAASDIHLDVRSVPYQKLSALESGEPSSAIRLRVEAARTVQQERFTDLGKAGVIVNGDMGPSEVQSYCALDDAGKNLMRAAVRQMDLSARAYHRVIKLSRAHRETAA
jgi:magnesium chelatase family protein